jgi:N-acetyl-alpha-D-glucosaminyl L-malate synthase BshA
MVEHPRTDMKIGITCYPTYGGSGVVASELGIELAARGHEVHFIAYSQPFRLSGLDNKNIFFHEVTVTDYPLFQYPPYDLALATKMAEVAVAEELDLLHVHYAIPHSVSAFLAREMLKKYGMRKLPFVTTLHGTDITIVGLDRSYLPITKFSIEESDGVTAISDYLREKTYQEFEVRNEIEVIYNFVNCDLYKRNPDTSARAQFADPDQRLLVHLSNFRPVKRVNDVVEIFDRVQKDLPARLLMIGDGPDRAGAEYLARQKGIHDKVHFLGKQGRVNELVGLCDVMLMPSQLESFGLVALEAMACEVPTVATGVGGVPEVVQDGVTGFLAKVGDVETMGRRALEILSDEDRLKQMRQAGRRVASERFCTSHIIPRYEAFYDSGLERMA